MVEPHKLVEGAYHKNDGMIISSMYDDNHSLTIDMSDWPIGDANVKLDEDNYPYFKLALIDKLLDDKYEAE